MSVIAHILDAVIRLKDNFSETLSTIENNMKNFSRTNIRMGRDITRVGRDFESAGKSLTAGITLPAVAAGTLAVNESIKIEDAVSGMSKTMDATPEKVKAIKKELDDLTTSTMPLAREEMFGIAETAGQLGIATDDITNFSEVIGKIGSVSDLDFNEGAASLAKFANITKMSADDYERLGSTITYLDSNTATSASAIVEMGTRLAGAGNQAKLTEAQIMGISAGMASVGIEAQAGGTSFSKVILKMNDSVLSGGKTLGKFAKIAGTSSKGFQSAFKKDAGEAISMFISGLGKMQDEGENVSAVIEDLGFTEARAKDALLRLSGASEMFSDTLGKSNTAWDENIALNDIFGKRTNNTASKLTIMKNQVSAIAEKFGTVFIPILERGLDAVSKFGDVIGNLSDEQVEGIVNIIAFAATLGPVLMIVGKLTQGIGGLITEVGFIGARMSKGASLMGAIMTPGMKIALVLLAIAGAVFVVIKNFDAIKAKINEVFPNLMDNISKTWEVLKHFGSQLATIGSFIFDIFIVKFQTMFTFVYNIVGAGIGLISDVLRAGLNIITGVLDIFIGLFTGNWTQLWEGVVSIFEGLILGVIDIAKGVVNGLISIINGFIGGLNAIKIPDFIPGIGGKGINIPLIPQLAKGTDNWGGGIVQVHERGGEIIDLPSGSRVYPHDESVSMARKQGQSERSTGGQIFITGNEFNIRDETDIDKIANALLNQIKKAKINMA